MTIKHLVISGGGPSGLLTYGIASYLERNDFWKLSNIESIYGCSIGAYIGVIISLGFEWECIDDYFIKRPWEKLVSDSKVGLVDIYDKKCLINDNFYRESIIPLLKAKDLNETITLKELYDYNSIEIHMFTTNINTYTLTNIDISYKTHPSLPLIKALQMTMAFPIIFEPIINDNNCYIDGGLLNNFPLNDCVNDQICDQTEILAFKNIWKTEKYTINDESTMFDFLLVLLKKMQLSIDSTINQVEIKHIGNCYIDELSGFDKWNEALNNELIRKEIIEKGYKIGETFISSFL